MPTIQGARLIQGIRVFEMDVRYGYFIQVYVDIIWTLHGYCTDTLYGSYVDTLYGSYMDVLWILHGYYIDDPWTLFGYVDIWTW